MEQKEKDKKNEKENFSLGNIIGGKIEFKDIEEILSREVKRFGDGSAHVLIPKKHLGRNAQITIWKKDEKENELKNKKDGGNS